MFVIVNLWALHEKSLKLCLMNLKLLKSLQMLEEQSWTVTLTLDEEVLSSHPPPSKSALKKIGYFT